MLKSFFITFIWLVVIPYILGKFLEKKEDSFLGLYSIVLGYIIEMGVFFLIAIPIIVLKLNFYRLLKFFNICIITLTIISVIINRKKLLLRNEKNFKLTFWKTMFFLIIAVLVFVKFTYTNVNNDDASFVVLATEMIETGKMYHLGNSELEMRRALAPGSAFYAVISQNINVHVTIFMHTYIPIIFILIGGIIFLNFGKFLFKKNNDSPYIFAFFVYLLYMYTFTIKGSGVYFLRYSWFGRAIVGSVFLPLIWKSCLEILNNEKNSCKWCIVFFAVLSSCCLTEMSIVLTSIPILIFSFFNFIKNRSFLDIIKSIICVAPCAITAVLYLVL